MIVESIQSFVDAFAAKMEAAAPAVLVTLGEHTVKQSNADPVTGRVVFVPAGSQMTLPTRQDFGSHGQRSKIVATFKQVFEVHCWAKAPKNEADELTAEERRTRQYGDDLTQAERLRTKVAAILLKWFEGPALPQPFVLTEAGENVHGVELVLTTMVEIQGRDLPLLLAPSESVFGAGGDCDCKDVPIKVAPSPDS